MFGSTIDYKELKRLWLNPIEAEWRNARDGYWNTKTVRRNIGLEKRLQDEGYVKQRIRENFKRFLIDEFIPWKYTDCRFVSYKCQKLKDWDEKSAQGYGKRICEYAEGTINATLTPDIIAEGIKLKNGIRGVGVAGITGLISLLNPSSFGTVDQFVARALMAVTDGEDDGIIVKYPMDIRVDEAVKMEVCMNKKVSELNRLFGDENWNARSIDMVLWSYGKF